MKTYRLLLVEDDEPLRLLTKTVLERTGRFKVVGEAADGDAGVDAARRLDPDLILLDLAMPRLHGTRALPQMCAAAPAAKIVVLSMLQRSQYESDVLARGAVAFVDKAVSSTELVARLLAIMEGPSGGGGDDGQFGRRAWTAVRAPFRLPPWAGPATGWSLRGPA